jgi:hypothetical protein
MLTYYRYLRYIESEKNSKKKKNGNASIRSAREELISAEVKKDRAWEVARHAYDPATPESFIDTLNDNDGYLSDWKTEADLLERYKAQDRIPEMQDVHNYIDVLKSANDRLVYYAG